MFERAFRRAELPVAYTEGFSPRPRSASASRCRRATSRSASTSTSTCDADWRPERPIDELEALPPRLSAALPMGIDVVAAAPIDAGTRRRCSRPSRRRRGGSPSSAPTVRSRRSGRRRGNGCQTIMATRGARARSRSTTCDRRSLDLALAGEPRRQRHVRRRARNPTSGSAPGRARRCGVAHRRGRARLRTHQWIERDGARWEPLPSGATRRAAREGACFMRREPPDVRTDAERRRRACDAGAAC